MKKTVAAISLFIYLAVSCGIVINFHYCMDKLASVELFEQKDSVCDTCGMETNSLGCCRDEITVLKLEDDQQQPISVSFEPPSIPIINSPSEYLLAILIAIENSRDWQNHSPPLLSEQDIFIVNRVFRI